MSSDDVSRRAKSSFDFDNEFLSALVDISQNIEKYLIYVFYIFMLFIVSVEVFRRYGLSMASFWSGEVARYSFLYITYIGISLAVYKRTHIRIDAIYSKVSQRVENYLYLFSNIIIFIFGLYAIRYTIPLIQTSLEFGATTQALAINRAFAQAAIPIGLVMMNIRVLQRSYYDIMDIRAGRPVYKGENVFVDEEEN